MSLVTHKITSITECESQWPQEYAVWLSSSERELLAGLRHGQRRREWLAGRWLCKQMIQTETRYGHCTSDSLSRQTLSAIEIQSHDGQRRAAKPRVFVEGRMLPMELSITHSHDWIGVAVSTTPNCRVGMDLVPRTTETNSRLAFWLTEDEQRWLHKNPNDAVLPVIWSIKESVYKASNRGAPFKPLQLNVCRSASGQYECDGRALTAGTKCSITVDTWNDHILTVATVLTHQNRILANAS